MYRHNRQLKHYFREIKKEIRMYSEGARFYKQWRDMIYSYISDNPNTTMDDIYQKYGTPSELEDTFFQQVDLQTYKEKTSFAKIVKRLLLIGFIAYIVVLLLASVDYKIHQPTTIEYTIETDS
ncbi:MAG: DUF6120 family protein [Clostridium sp.]|nr:DUF6120 family protein [Clostridium sp.]